MEKMGLNDIREAFLKFWESKGHYRLKSFPLIPQHDKSLLIINSGMAPMKAFFAGTEEPPSKRVTTCQKCIRTPDLENVGHTARHGTFFEMMGNFSFGDYFKEDAIKWGWEFSTEVLKLPKEKLWVTIYENDDEAREIWHDMVGVPDEKIVRLGKDDNFWQIGTGPCGPCSEIYYDRGEQYSCGRPDCKPGCECDRYIEYWNLVFTQFDAKEDGTYGDLVQKNIDTGLGLERMACIMQGVDSIFDVDTLRHVIQAIEKRCNVKYVGDGSGEFDIPIRIVTDHVRSATFMIGDKIMPGNEGRGYVLRRLIRRAARNGRKMGVEGCFLADIVDSVIDICGDAYPELPEQRVFIKKIIENEEKKFADTLDQGMDMISGFIKELNASGSKVLAGDKAFKLHDTYGFPIDITTDILADEGFEVDVEGFEKLMAQQKAAGKEDAAETDAAWDYKGYAELEDVVTQFTGYEKSDDDATVVAIYRDHTPVDSLAEEVTGTVVFDKTPFYATSGGQAAETGLCYTSETGEGFEGYVSDVTKHDNVFLHTLTVNSGELKVGDTVHCKVELTGRNNSSRNHTATHLLHQALRQVLGEHVQQAGSLVNKDTLRFDFSHFEAMTDEQIKQVEDIVNEQISLFLPVSTEVMDIKEAGKSGAIGLFDSKYGEEVRVVSIGDFSKELCGGIHVKNSGQIGAFRILSESGIASGVRRIEAVTGNGLKDHDEIQSEILANVCNRLKTKPDQLDSRIGALITELQETKKELSDMKNAELASASGQLINEAKEINGIRLITKKYDGLKIDELRTISDDIKAENNNVALVLATVNDGKVTFLVSLTDDVVSNGYHAGKMIKEIAAAAGGGGGGKANMAQAGAKDPSKIEDAFKTAEGLL